jgi:hypothetical protein
MQTQIEVKGSVGILEKQPFDIDKMMDRIREAVKDFPKVEVI